MLSTAAYGREKSLRIQDRRIGIGEMEEKPETEGSSYEELETSERRVYGIKTLDLGGLLCSHVMEEQCLCRVLYSR